MNNRISMVLKAKNISPAQLADDLGVQRSGISHILNGRNKPSLDFIQKLIRLYPDISIQWLLFGEGPMMNPYPSKDTEPAKRDPEPAPKPKPLMMELFADEITHEEKYSTQQKENDPEPDNQSSDKQSDESSLKDTEKGAPEYEIKNEPEKNVISPTEAGKELKEKATGLAADIPAADNAQKFPDKPGDGRRLVKIVMFYSDKTFAEYLPEI